MQNYTDEELITMKKGRITRIGQVINHHAVGFAFDGLGVATGLEVREDDTVLICGWTLDELRTISAADESKAPRSPKASDLRGRYRPERGIQYVSADGQFLISEFNADPGIGIPAGILVCRRWTDADDALAHDSDHALSLTVSREWVPDVEYRASSAPGHFVQFHDAGTFIPLQP